MWAALPKKLSEALSKTYNALQMAKQLRKTHAVRLSQSDVTPIARSSFTVPEIVKWAQLKSIFASSRFGSAKVLFQDHGHAHASLSTGF